MMDNKNEIPKQQIKSLINKTDGAHQKQTQIKRSCSQFQMVFEGSLEVKLPTTWTDEKQRWEESESREE